MKYKLFGKSGLRVSELCLSAISFGQNPGDMVKGVDKEEARRMFDLFAESGGNFIDMSNTQQGGEAERYVGEFCAQDRGRFVLAGKIGVSTDSSDPNARGAHRKNIVQALERSLARLNTDYLDLVWVNGWDSMTPIEETVAAVEDIAKAGKVLYAGFSNLPAWVVARADVIAAVKGWSPIVGIDILYSVFERSCERELLPMARMLDLGVLCWSVMARDVLSGKLNSQTASSSSYSSDRNLAIARELKKTSDETGRTPAQICLNWIRQQPGPLVPLLGVRTEAQMRDQLGCLDFRLDDEQLCRISNASALPPEYPGDFGDDSGRQYRVENHHIYP